MTTPDASAAEMIAACKAIVRLELKLPRGADALAALHARLSPEDPAARPPARAPAIARLRKTLRSLRAGRVPAATLDELTDDLRVLALFADEPLSATALTALLRDVRAEPAPKRRRAPRAPTPLERPRRDA